MISPARDAAAGPVVRSMAQVSGPSGFISHKKLDDAIETALALGQPLLLTGDPGCGKTEVGNYVALKKELGSAIKLTAKSQMLARDLFYTYDTVGRFHAANLGNQKDDPVRFIDYVGLGKAIVLATDPDEYAQFMPPHFQHPGKRRSVVLIDEVDKAPRDVPNDLLHELENMSFRIPELQAEIRADPTDYDFRPILVITSNSEKALPDAFLRRCIYYHMPFPDRQTLLRIVRSRLGDAWEGSALANDAVTVFNHLQKERKLRKEPGTAEMLGFLLALQRAGFATGARLKDKDGWLNLAAVTLMKTRDDQREAAVHLAEIDWSAATKSS